MQLRRLAWLFATALTFVGAIQARAASKGPPIDFNRDIRPILSNRCNKCHGFDEKQRQGGLRLDTPDGATAKLESGHCAIVPGDSAKSELIARVTNPDADERMPPADEGKKLTDAQIELLRRWIDQGAKYRGLWSFTPPQRPELPALDQPPWVHNEIDHFVLAKLKQEGKQPSCLADKTTLIRRVTFDLIGLPPTPAEVDAFLADNSPQAYETVVNRLLASPRYGEHMARDWLDAVRYGDTHGLHFDNIRTMWPYRDYVIKAFNSNMPFDRFTIEQMAGDLLPNATTDQKIASGYNRCNVSSNEGGSIDEELFVRYGIDRVSAMGTVWLGLTVGCAVCHDHKFDPITQKDFYRLKAFYDASADKAMDGNLQAPPPALPLPSPEDEAKLKAIDKEMVAARYKIADEVAKYNYSEPAADAELPQFAERQDYYWIDDELPPGADKTSDSGKWRFMNKDRANVFHGTMSLQTQAADKAFKETAFSGAKPGLKIGQGDKLIAYLRYTSDDAPRAISLAFYADGWGHRAYWGDDLIPQGATGTPSHVAMGELPPERKWVRIEVEAEKVGLKPGDVITGWSFGQVGGKIEWDAAGISSKIPQVEQAFQSQQAWEKFVNSTEIIWKRLPKPVQEAVKVPADKRDDAAIKLIREYFLANVCVTARGIFGSLEKEVADLDVQKTKINDAVPAALIMADLPKPRDTFVLVRGAYDKHAEKVTAGVPSALPPLPAGAPVNRLGLAKWLIDSSNPLTARVIVNRFWQHYFGQGIVKTSGDFGSQGAWPSHPELLDWLATEFERSGWDVKHLQKLIVMSGTYQQSSRATPEEIQADPENALLARGPRFRLDAEMIRDEALAVSGLLVERVGGPSVDPYQPDGIWEAVAFHNSNTEHYKQGHHDALYRRSMYTFWKRTAPPPAMSTFDAPSRETCTVHRSRTDTPLQALALMNDIQFVEAARNLGQRVMMEGGGGRDQRLNYLFRLATARRPEADELKILQTRFDALLKHYQSDKEAALSLLKVGESKSNDSLDPSELATWTMTANLVLNLDETITKQ